jgi:hypothetical protein
MVVEETTMKMAMMLELVGHWVSLSSFWEDWTVSDMEMGEPRSRRSKRMDRLEPM